MRTVTHFAEARVLLKDGTESFETDAKNISTSWLVYLTNSFFSFHIIITNRVSKDFMLQAFVIFNIKFTRI